MNRWLERLFLLLILSLGFMQPSLSLRGMSLPLTDLIFLVVFLAMAATVTLRRRSAALDRSYVYFVGFIVAMAVSALFSVSFRDSTLKLAGAAYLAGLAILTLNVVDTVESLRRVTFIWLAGSTIASLVGVLTVVLFYIDRNLVWHEFFLHHYGSLPAGNYPRVQSTFIYPAMLCNFLTVGTLLTLGSWKAGWFKGGTAAVLAALHLFAAAFTVTPGLGGLLFGLSLFAGLGFYDKRRTGLGVALVGMGVLAGAAFTAVALVSIWPIPTSPYTLDLFGYLLDPTQRLLAWQHAARTFGANPYFGKGLGTAAANVLFRTPSGQMQLLTDAHNTWLSVAAQSGIIGLSSIVALTVHIVRRGLATRVVDEGLVWLNRSLWIAFVSCFIVQGLVGSFEDSRHLWVLMGLILASSRIFHKQFQN